MPLTGDPRLWKPWHKQGAIWAVLGDIPDHGHRVAPRCATCNAAIEALLPRIGTKPIRFANRVDGVWVDVDLATAQTRLRNLVYEIHEHASEWRPEPDPGEPTAVPTPVPVPEPTPVPTPSEGVFERYYAEIQRIRAFARSRDLECLDSMRITLDGARALKAGAPIVALVASIMATWPTDTRAQFANYRPTPSELRPVPVDGFDYGAFGERPNPFAHRVSAYVTALVRANVPVWLHGPAGTGKSTAAKAAATLLGLDYYEVNLAGAMASAIKGKQTLTEIIVSEFTKAYELGGLICLEEFDAAHPTVATAINNAIAGDEFHNDLDGRNVKRHPNFRIVATANTLGNGATKEFGSRMNLDGATKDRFRIGRVYVGLDLELERTIYTSMTHTLALAA